jgi:hypothetical protein
MRRSTSGGRIAPSVRIVWNWSAFLTLLTDLHRHRREK